MYERSKRIAEIIHDRIIRASGLPDRGVIERNDLAGFNWSNVPVILLELGYLTNPIEDRLLNDNEFQFQIVKAITEGIEDSSNVISLS